MVGQPLQGLLGSYPVHCAPIRDQVGLVLVEFLVVGKQVVREGNWAIYLSYGARNPLKKLLVVEFRGQEDGPATAPPRQFRRRRKRG